jgi:hypothetical protein
VKQSFSPFGRKPVAATNNAFYAPSSRVTGNDVNPLSTAKTVSEIPSMDVPYRPYSVDTPVPTSTMTPKKSYSPFGTKPVAPKNDSLYDAPRFAEWDDEPLPTTTNNSNNNNNYSSIPPMPFAATSLEEVTMTEDDPIPPTFSTSGGSGGGRMKKSYSPFGSKPQASSGSGGGYLEGL